MATPARMFSLDHHLLERMRYSGIEKENLADLVSILVSLKNKYGIVPFNATAVGLPMPNAISAGYQMDSLMMNKLMNVLCDTPRLAAMNIVPRGIPKAGQFEVTVTIGG